MLAVKLQLGFSAGECTDANVSLEVSLNQSGMRCGPRRATPTIRIVVALSPLVRKASTFTCAMGEPCSAWDVVRATS